MRKILLVVTFAFFIVGCSSSKKEVSIPSWYLNVPNSNPNKIYGVGQSSTLEQAKKEALKNMSESLLVSIKTSYKSNTKTTTNGINQNYFQENIKNIETKTKQIDFTNYKVDKAVNLANSFYVLISVDRYELFINQKEKLELQDKQIDSFVNSLEHKSKLEKIYSITNYKQNLDDGKNSAIIVNAINNDFDKNPYILKYDEISNKADSLKNSIVIDVVSTNEEAYKEYLVTLFNQNGYKVSNKNADVEATIFNNIRHSTARGWNIAKVTSTISVKANGKNLSNHTINTIGKSSSSIENAIADSANSFSKEIEKIGIENILFN